MTHVSEILDPDNLTAMVIGGYIRKQTNPNRDLWIYNYTPKATFDGMWNNETMTCRGLIVDVDGTVVARPFRKFFNLSQHESPNVPDAPTGKYRVFDKADGSLGIMYPTGNGEAAIATRGSFSGEQALKATAILHAKYQDWLVKFSLMPYHENYTLLFEIIYPENRIVLDYGSTEDLVFLGTVHIPTGRTCFFVDWGWPGPKVECYPVRSFDDLAAENRPNKEGYVLWYHDTDERLKVKHEDYLTLHRLVTNSSTKSVWRLLASGNRDELQLIPQEFRNQVDRCVIQFENQFEDIYDDARDLVDCCCRDTGPAAERRDEALYFKEHAKDRTVLAAAFAILDGKPFIPIIWRSLEPKGSESLWL